MKFVQIIEFEATEEQLAQGDALVEEYMKQTEGKRTSGRSTLLRDRANPSKYYNVVEFASYEEAMRNNELPETKAMSERMMAISSGPPRFIDCDVVRERSQ
jgi:quinol monooxygenase YgiN